MKKLSFLTAVILAIATVTVNAQTSGKAGQFQDTD